MKTLIPFLFFLLISSVLIAQPGSPVLSEPPDVDNNISLAPFFDWEDVPGATDYNIQVSDVISFPSDELEDDAVITPSEFQHDPTVPLNNDTRYYWRVRAFSGTAYGSWSEVWSFTTTAGDQVIFENNEPKTYAIYQNHPNPFNPVTLIKYSIPKTSFVTIVIYDLLGREVTKLVNDEKPAGSYETEWNGGFVPSGVYIYKITAGDFTDTKKMVLVK